MRRAGREALKVPGRLSASTGEKRKGTQQPASLSPKQGLVQVENFPFIVAKATTFKFPYR